LHDDIAHRAFEIYDRKGRQPNECTINWQQAESELRVTSAAPIPAESDEALSKAHTGSMPANHSLANGLESVAGAGCSTRGTTPVPRLAHETH
jgi:hypothetical protein